MLIAQPFEASCCFAWTDDHPATMTTAMPGRALLLLLATMSLALSVWSSTRPALLPQHDHAVPQHHGSTAPDVPSISVAPSPPPMQLLEIPADRARRLNAAVPFSTSPNPAALPFRFSGDAQSRLRAIDCLASAAYYEAGGDVEGQRAVAQVVLNRVRHPAFPATVCGVVYQGSERSTGCQFTFTCDGALRRRPLPSLWKKAQTIARAAIEGHVYAPVGLATHYHTDWVLPVWSGSLEKIGRVRTHLFFRWPGSWGRPAAFHLPPPTVEPLEPELAAISDLHRSPEAAGASSGTNLLAVSENGNDGTIGNDVALQSVDLRGSKLRLVHPAGDAFGFLLPTSMPGSFGLLALDVCRGRSFCKVMGWTEAAAIPPGFPIPYEARRKMAFLYVHDGRAGEIVAWNCALFPRRDPAECLDARLTQWDSVQQVAGIR